MHNPLVNMTIDWTDEMASDFKKYESEVKNVFPRCRLSKDTTVEVNLIYFDHEIFKSCHDHVVHSGMALFSVKVTVSLLVSVSLHGLKLINEYLRFALGLPIIFFLTCFIYFTFDFSFIIFTIKCVCGIRFFCG